MTQQYRSPCRYPGGKQKAMKIIDRFLPDKVSEVRDVFMGGGSFTFHARNKGLAETFWANDKNDELINFWEHVKDPNLCLQLIDGLHELKRSFRTVDDVRQHFELSRDRLNEGLFCDPSTYFFLNRVSFSGATRAGGFSPHAALKRFTESSIDRLRPMPAALKAVNLTCLDFGYVILEPGEKVLLMVDPPYPTAKKLYGTNGDLHTIDHKSLAFLLKRTEHCFLLTYGDCDYIRDLYSWADIKEVTWKYGMTNQGTDGKCEDGRELIIRNYT